jgi:hypothetical protein
MSMGTIVPRNLCLIRGVARGSFFKEDTDEILRLCGSFRVDGWHRRGSSPPVLLDPEQFVPACFQLLFPACFQLHEWARWERPGPVPGRGQLYGRQ